MELAAAQNMIGNALGRSSLSVVIFDDELRIAWANGAAEEPRPGQPARASAPSTTQRAASGRSPAQDTRLRLWPTRTASPPPASLLVLYTDGLIERPGTDILTGMASLVGELASVSKLNVHDACDALLDALAAHPADDIALLMART